MLLWAVSSVTSFLSFLLDESGLEDHCFWGLQGPADHAGKSTSHPELVQAQLHISDPHPLLMGFLTHLCPAQDVSSLSQAEGGLVTPAQLHFYVLQAKELLQAGPL